MQVAKDVLAGSTERAVTVSGSASAITRCLQEICSVMLEVSCNSFVDNTAYAVFIYAIAKVWDSGTSGSELWY